MTNNDLSGIRIVKVRIKNFRCLELVEVSLGDLTVLIGENNAGKSSFVDALHAAVGAGSRSLGGEDVFLQSSEQVAPRSREVLIDLLIRPLDSSDEEQAIFPEGSPWLELFANAVQQDDENDADFVGIRTKLSWDPIKHDYFVERRFLKSWSTTLAEIEKSEVAEQVSQVTAKQLEPLSLYLLDAKRDAAEDLRNRGSVWQKMVSEPGLSPEDVADIEKQLNVINSLIIEKSEVLSHVQQHLTEVSDVLDCDSNGVAVAAVARKFRDLNKGMDVVLSTSGASQFPLARQGLGTRSLATFFLFRAYMSWRNQKHKHDALHPFVAVEEPESHLHPQAQRAAYNQISSIPGQKLITTHSPFVCSQVEIAQFAHFSKSESSTSVNQLDPTTEPKLSTEDLRRIRREVMNTRGELMFARCIILSEGETEEQALAEFFQLYFKKHPHELGINFIGVGGNKYLPFLRVCKTFKIPWLIFSDGESEPVKSLDQSLDAVGESKSAANQSVFVIPNGQGFEEYICTQGADTELKRMIVDFVVENQQNSSPQFRNSIESKWASRGNEELIKELKDCKTAYAPRIAHAFSNREEEKRFPNLITELFDAIALRPLELEEPSQ